MDGPEQRGRNSLGGENFHQQNGGKIPSANSEATYLAGLPLSGQWCSTMAFLAPRSSMSRFSRPPLFPNSFSYMVFANIGSGAVPGRLPNHGFREGSGEGSEPWVLGRFRDRFRGCWG